MPKVIIFMESGSLSDVIADFPGLEVFKVEDDDMGDAAQGDEFRLLKWPGKDGSLDARWAYSFGKAGSNKRLLKTLIPQILSDDTYATFCEKCRKDVFLKDSEEFEGRRFCKPCGTKAKEKKAQLEKPFEELRARLTLQPVSEILEKYEEAQKIWVEVKGKKDGFDEWFLEMLFKSHRNPTAY